MKRIALCVCLIALLGCRKKQAPHTIGLAVDVGGRGDQSFNDGALRGLEIMAAGLRYTARGYERLGEAEYRALLPSDLREMPFPHLAIPEPLVLSGKAQEDYEPNLQLLAIGKFEAGFRAGVRQANPSAEVLVAYTGTFDDERKGIEVGHDLYQRGCDIVFHAAGLDGLGVIKAAQQAGKLVIGVDSDQSHVAPGNVLTSMVKHVDVAGYLAVKDVPEKKFSGGDIVLGLREGGVGLAPIGGMGPPPPRAATVLAPEKLRAQIVGGQLTVPSTLDELAKFVAARP